MIAGVSERSGGVPLFVEEVTRLLLERGEQGGVQAIPPTLQQSLAARLDRLGPAREIAQIGAVLGRGFSHALLQAVAGLDEPALRAALDRLADAELLFVEGVAPHANYRFKHALIQDAAYDSLLKSRRQTLHRRAAEVLLASPAPEAEALAHHFTQAGQTDLAIEWWGKAGDQALRRSAFAEAISHLGKAIELSDKAGGAARPRDAAASRIGQPAAEIADRLRPGRHVVQGLRRRRNESRLRARRRACDARLAMPRRRSTPIIARWAAQYISRRAWVRPGSGRELPARGGTRGAADRGGGRASHFRMDSPPPGRFREGADALRTDAANLRPRARPRSQVPLRSGLGSRGDRAIWLSRLGAWRTSNARESSWTRRSRARSNPLMSRRSPAVYSGQGLLEILRDDAEAARRAAEAAVALGREHGLTLYLDPCSAATWPGRARSSAIGTPARPNFDRRVADYASQGNKLHLPFYQGLLAEIEAERGEAEAALAGIDEALALAGETGEHWFDAGLHRIRGEILLKQNPADPAPAEAAFLAAIAVAQQQKARSFELRAALSLAKLYQSTGRPIDAHDVLGPALQGFSPTPEFPQVREALELVAKIKTTPQF